MAVPTDDDGTPLQPLAHPQLRNTKSELQTPPHGCGRVDVFMREVVAHPVPQCIKQ